MRPDRAALRAYAGSGVLPALLTGLVRGPARSSAPSPAGADAAERFRRDYATGSGQSRDKLARDLVHTQVGAVLGHPGPGGVEDDRPFSESGFDSLTALELRNRLNAASGLTLPATLVFDYPTPGELAAHIGAELAAALGVSGPARDGAGGEDGEDAAVRRALASIPVAHLRSSGLLEPLLRLVGARNGGASESAPGAPDGAGSVDGMDLDDLVKHVLGGDGN
ncbi:acyl carrier protein [Actinomadura madurae]